MSDATEPVAPVHVSTASHLIPSSIVVKPTFTPVKMFLKHEGTSKGRVVGPVFYEGAKGETCAFAKMQVEGHGEMTCWYNEPQARAIAKAQKLSFEVF